MRREKAIEKLGIKSIDELVNKFEDDEWERFLTMYKIIDVIGSGGYGVVLAAIDKAHRKKVALKIVFKSDY